jgi:hypothetical protein
VKLNRCVAALAVFPLVVSGAFVRTAYAQSASDLGAWDGLMLTPIGALPPVAREAADSGARRNELSIRYGRWRYDLDDAIHNNVGVTLSHTLDSANTEISLTGAYLSLSCSACSIWLSWGVGVRSTLWHGAVPGAPEGTAIGSVALRADVGAGRYFGEGHAVASSAAAAIALGAGVPFVWNSRLSVTALPGYGYGRLAAVDGVDSGTRPTFGAAAAWTFASGFGVDLGMERIIISGGPTQVGLGFGWRP